MRTWLAALSLALLAACAGMKPAEPAVDDATLTTQVKAALAADPELGGAKIDAQSTQGAVRLKGDIKSITLRRKAEEVTKGVKGVKSVDNQLVITG